MSETTAVTTIADTLVANAGRVASAFSVQTRAWVAPTWRTRHQHTALSDENWNPNTATPGCDWCGECEWCDSLPT